MKINGQMYDWSSITVGMLGPVTFFTAIEYEDSREVKKVFGRGRRAVGRALGNYDASGKITLHREGFEQFMLAVQALGHRSVYDMPPIPITITYTNGDKPTVTDVLQGVLFTGQKNGGTSQNSEAATVDLDLDIEVIRWNGREPK